MYTVNKTWDLETISFNISFVKINEPLQNKYAHNLSLNENGNDSNFWFSLYSDNALRVTSLSKDSSSSSSLTATGDGGGGKYHIHKNTFSQKRHDTHLNVTCNILIRHTLLFTMRTTYG